MLSSLPLAKENHMTKLNYKVLEKSNSRLPKEKGELDIIWDAVNVYHSDIRDKKMVIVLVDARKQ